MHLTKETIIKPFHLENVERPWGFFSSFADNKKCTVKILYIGKDELLSMQYHFKRDQFYLMLDDNFIIEYSNVPVAQEVINNPDEQWRVQYFERFLKENMITVTANEGAMFGFKRFVVHRATYKGTRSYGRVLDIAFGINDEEDIVRIQDKYDRK